MSRLLDLNVPLEDSVGDSQHPSLVYSDHRQTAAMTTQFLGVQVSDLPDGLGWAVETVTASTHNGTHVDALGIISRPTVVTQPVLSMNCRLNDFLPTACDLVFVIRPKVN
jgi:hypothetical protein